MKRLLFDTFLIKKWPQNDYLLPIRITYHIPQHPMLQPEKPEGFMNPKSPREENNKIEDVRRMKCMERQGF